MVSIRAPRLDIALTNPMTSKIYQFLRANEWIAKNYEFLCRNEVVDCDELIEDIVRTKLEIMTKRIKNSNDQILISENVVLEPETSIPEQVRQHQYKPYGTLIQ